MTIARLVLLAVAALALAVALGRIPRPARRLRRSWSPRLRERPGMPADLASLERVVWMASANAADRHHRLAPLVRGIARHRLAAYRGVDLDRDPDTASRLLGPVAWELVRPDAPPPADRFASGIGEADLHAVVDALDQMTANG